MKKLKIMHLTHHFWPCTGGVEKVVLDSCNALAENGIECVVACLNRCPKETKRLKAEEMLGRTKIIRLGFVDLKYYKPAFGLLKAIKRENPDVLHVHGLGFFSDFTLLSKPLHKKPVVVSTHGGIFHTKSMGAAKKIYFNAFQKILLKRADKIIAISENDKMLFSEILPPGKISLIENSVSLEKFFSLSGRKRKNSFVFVGRLSKNKRVDRLLEAFAEAKKSLSDFSLHVCGGDFDDLQEKLARQAVKAGLEKNVFFDGSLTEKELLQRLGKSEFFVSASEYEGFGISLAEAMAAGCIPIVNRIPSFEKIVEDRKSGFIADFSDAKKTAQKIAEIARKPAGEKQKIVKSAEKKAQEYSIEKNIGKLTKLYSEVAE